MTEKEKADVYAKLAELAWLRFNSRRDIEWKSAVGIWSAFGAATLGVFASSATFTWVAIVVTFVIVFAIVSIYGWWWLPYISETMRRDQRVSYFWESGIQQVCDRRIPDKLEPWALGDTPDKDWGRMPAVAPPPAEPPQGPVTPPANDTNRREMRRLHVSQKCQLAICALFGALLLLAVWIRAFSPSAAVPKLAVEGQFDAEKVKLAR